MYDANDLKHIAKFFEIYDMLMDKGELSADEIKKNLVKGGMAETTARRMVAEFRYPLNENLLTLNKSNRYEISSDGIEDFIDGFGEWTGQQVWTKWYIEDQTGEYQKLLDEYETALNKSYEENMNDERENRRLKRDVETLTSTVSQLESQIESMEKDNLCLKERLEKVATESERKLRYKCNEVNSLYRDIEDPVFMLKGFFRALFKRG